jgi:hypothetical protein
MTDYDIESLPLCINLCSDIIHDFVKNYCIHVEFIDISIVVNDDSILQFETIKGDTQFLEFHALMVMVGVVIDGVGLYPIRTQLLLVDLVMYALEPLTLFR